MPDKRAFKHAKRSQKANKTLIEENEYSNDNNMFLKIDTSNEENVYELYDDEEYVLNLDLNRINRINNTRRDLKAYAPKYPKPKDENWIVLLGNDTELVGLKRLNCIKSQQTMHILFKTPKLDENLSDNEDLVLNLTLYFMSDVYLGLDQQYELNFALKRRNK